MWQIRGLWPANRHKSGPEPSKGNLRKRGKAPPSQGEAGTLTISRLGEIGLSNDDLSKAPLTRKRDPNQNDLKSTTIQAAPVIRKVRPNSDQFPCASG